jgi:site-specific recombinase XerD
MKNRITTHIYVKEARKDKKGEAPIYLRITINGERAEISLGKFVNPALWDKAAERVAGRTEESRTKNSAITTILGKVERYYSALDVRDERISVSQIISELKGKGMNQITLVQAYESHIANLEKLSGIDYAVATVKKYGYSLDNLKRFLLKRYNKSDIRLRDLDHRFIEDYNTFLRTTENMMHNSAVKNIKHLIRVIHISIANKWISNNPFESFSCNYVNPNRSYLTNEEIRALYNKALPIKRLERVRDVFIFQIYTGLSYIDMAKLTDDSVEIGIDGGKWIVIDRQKTGIRSSIPILPQAQEVLDKYKNDPFCISEHKLLPVCTNQRMNGYLKEIATICEINKNLTTHLARHTFATTITLSNGVPIETVSKMLGHSDLKTTQIYSKVVDRKISDDMKSLFDKKIAPVPVANIN